MIDSINEKKLDQLFTTVIDYLFSIFTILQCNSIYFREDGNKNKIQIIWMILLMLLLLKAVINMVMRNTNIIPLLEFEILFVMSVFVFLIISYQRYSFGVSMVLLYLIFPAIGVVIFYDLFLLGQQERILIRLKNVTVFLAGLSIFFWVLSTMGVPTNSTATIAWGGYQDVSGYLDLHFIAQGKISFMGFNAVRNTGFFVEAPMYSYILCIGLMISVFIDHRKRLINYQSLLLMVAIVISFGNL